MMSSSLPVCSASARLPVSAAVRFVSLSVGRCSARSPNRSLGPILYVDLLLAHVLLNNLLVLDSVLADPKLLLDHGALLGDDLFLYHRHRDLVLADLRL